MHRSAYIFLLLTTLLWGGNSVAGKLAVDHVSPMTLVFLRWVLAVAIMLPIGWKTIQKDWPVVRKHWFVLVALGASGFTLFNTIFYTALNYTTAINVSIEQAAMPILKDAGIPVITIGVRTESLTDRRAKTGWPVYRLGPRGDDERNAIASALTHLWQNELFAIIDDGTIYGREIVETLRAAAEQAALKPVFVDTFRPQLDNQIGMIGRLKKAGATHVFAGGDGDDIAIMGRDAAQLQAGIVFAG
ncbi:MAG: hypothetical protein E5Y74_06015, partial [Mesorhizobium sp.]